MGLCCLGALRGLCGFCVREWLGGLKDCGVFAFVFLLLCLSFSLFVLACCPLFFFALVVFACPLALSFLSCFGFVFSFSLSDYTQEGRKGFAPCVLLCSVVSCFI